MKHKEKNELNIGFSIPLSLPFFGREETGVRYSSKNPKNLRTSKTSFSYK